MPTQPRGMQVREFWEAQPHLSYQVGRWIYKHEFQQNYVARYMIVEVFSQL
jgi:hypothetical protein